MEESVQKMIVSPATLPDATKYGYSQGVRVGNLLFLGGQGGQDHEGQVPEPADFEAQVRRTFANMQAVLEAAGGTLANIVTMTTFIVDMRYGPELARLRREILGRDFPADALIGVSQLFDPALMLEIQAIAVLD
jgi:2-iminobutanoate/2-iminopropanoate deaminase